MCPRYNDYNGDESNDGGSSYDGLEIGSAHPLPKHRLYSNIEEEEENKLPGKLGTFTPDGVSWIFWLLNLSWIFIFSLMRS